MLTFATTRWCARSLSYLIFNKDRWIHQGHRATHLYFAQDRFSRADLARVEMGSADFVLAKPVKVLSEHMVCMVLPALPIFSHIFCT